MKKYEWSNLNHLQLGRYAEYLAKMEFTMYGFDVYSAEVDDKGIDFVIKKGSLYYDIQVKSVKGNNYIFFPKAKFEIRNNLFATVMYFKENNPPSIYLIPSTAWLTPNNLLVDKDYNGLKSKPEYGINASLKNESLLAQYLFESSIENIK